MEITVTITVEVERPDGSYTKTTERRERHAGDSPHLEAAECAQAVSEAAVVISRRIKARIEDGI